MGVPGRKHGVMAHIWRGGFPRLGDDTMHFRSRLDDNVTCLDGHSIVRQSSMGADLLAIGFR